MPSCFNCGSPISEEDKFCKNCGKSLEKPKHKKLLKGIGISLGGLYAFSGVVYLAIFLGLLIPLAMPAVLYLILSVIGFGIGAILIYRALKK